MLFIHCKRDQLYSAVPKGLVAVELGVFRAENAERIAEICQPRELHLVDRWEARKPEDYPYLDEAAFRSIMEYSTPYYGGDPAEQTTHDAIFASAKERMASKASITFYRCSTTDFLAQTDARFDMAYIDASHQYEDVLRDIRDVIPKMTSGGLIFFNDCVYSHHAQRQNMGVLQAIVSTLKLARLLPIVLTSGHFADCVLAVDGLQGTAARFVEALEQLPAVIIELPPELLASWNHRSLSLWESRAIPSFVISREPPWSGEPPERMIKKEQTLDAGKMPMPRTRPPGIKGAVRLLRQAIGRRIAGGTFA